MFGIYKAKKIYILGLAKVTDVKLPGMWTQGYTKSRNLKNLVVAKLVGSKVEHRMKTEYFKIIRTGEIVHNNHNNTGIGDLLVRDKECLLSYLNKPVAFTTKKALLDFEDYLNKPEEETKTTTVQPEPQLSK